MRPCLPAIERRQAERQRNGVVIRPPRRPDLHDEAVDLLLVETGIGERGVERLAGKIERSEEHTSELQSLMRTSYAVFCLTKNNKHDNKQGTFCPTTHHITITCPQHLTQ